MIRFLEYLFYRFYRFQSSRGHNDTPKSASFFLLIMLTGFYMLNLLFILELFKISIPIAEGNAPAIAFAICIGLVYYFLLIHNKKYERIIKKYENETEKQIDRGNKIAALIVLAPFIIFGIVISLLLSSK